MADPHDTTSYRPMQHWTPNELVRAVERALPLFGKRRHAGFEALEELRLRALKAPYGR